MMNNSSISLVSIVVAWTALGQTGCTSDAAVRPPDIDDCATQRYRIAAIDIPTSVIDALEVAFDLDGDGTRDNWLGLANALVHAWSPEFELAERVDDRLAAGLDWQLAVHQCEPGGPASVALAAGDDDDSVETARGRIPGPPLIGGTFAIPLGALSDALGTAEPTWVAAPLAAVAVERFDDREAVATIGVAITAEDLREVVAPNLAAYFTARLAADDSDFAAAADADGNGVVTTTELLASDAAQALLVPDLATQLDLPTGGASLGFRIHGLAR